MLYERDGETGERQAVWGKSLEERADGEEHPLSGFASCYFTAREKGLLVATSLFDDAGGPGYLDLAALGEVEPVAVEGIVHEGAGEFEGLRRIENDRFVALYNIDGCSWAYEATFDEAARTLRLERVLCGEGELEGGVLHGIAHDAESGRFTLSFCTATTPTQLFVVDETVAAPQTRETSARARSRAALAGRGRLVHLARRAARLGAALPAVTGARV